MTQTTTPTSATVHIERQFAFPREAVFDAWTRPELLARWFAPRGCTLTIVRAEIREGGVLHACIHNPEFGDCWTVSEYSEVLRPTRLAFVMRNADAEGRSVAPVSQGHHADWPASTRVVVTFTDHAGGTKVILTQNVSEALAKQTGAYPSWLQMLDGLGELLAGRTPVR